MRQFSMVSGDKPICADGCVGIDSLKPGLKNGKQPQRPAAAIDLPCANREL
jgi:hypothetical protein